MPDKFKEKVKTASDEELRNMLSLSNHNSPNWRCIFDEIQLRGISEIGKVHWFQHMANVAAVVAAIAGILSVWLMWPKGDQLEKKETQQTQHTLSSQQTDKK